MLTDLFTWWTEQMRDLVPASARSFLDRRWRPELLATADLPDTSSVTLSLRTSGGETALGRHGLTGTGLRETLARLPRARRAAAVLRTPADLLLEQEVVLPLSAEQDLRQVVEYEMDRLTPFRAEQVFWTCLAGLRDTARNRLHVRLTIIPRRGVEPVLTALRQAGLIATRIEAGTAAARRVIPLAAERTGRRWLGPRTEAYALGGCGVLAAAAVALPFVLQSLALAELDTRIEAVRPQVEAVEKLRRQIAGSAAAGDVIVTARQQIGSPLHSIALLTEVLPDDTYVTTLGLRQRKLSVSGRSASAARLICAMTAHPEIHGPAFVAPVIRDETSGAQMFSIRADLGP